MAVLPQYESRMRAAGASSSTTQGKYNPHSANSAVTSGLAQGMSGFLNGLDEVYDKSSQIKAKATASQYEYNLQEFARKKAEELAGMSDAEKKKMLDDENPNGYRQSIRNEAGRLKDILGKNVSGVAGKYLGDILAQADPQRDSRIADFALEQRMRIRDKEERLAEARQNAINTHKLNLYAIKLTGMTNQYKEDIQHYINTLSAEERDLYFSATSENPGEKGKRTFTSDFQDFSKTLSDSSGGLPKEVRDHALRMAEIESANLGVTLQKDAAAVIANDSANVHAQRMNAEMISGAQKSIDLPTLDEGAQRVIQLYNSNPHLNTTTDLQKALREQLVNSFKGAIERGELDTVQPYLDDPSAFSFSVNGRDTTFAEILGVKGLESIKNSMDKHSRASSVRGTAQLNSDLVARQAVVNSGNVGEPLSDEYKKAYLAAKGNSAAAESAVKTYEDTRNLVAVLLGDEASTEEKKAAWEGIKEGANPVKDADGVVTVLAKARADTFKKLRDTIAAQMTNDPMGFMVKIGELTSDEGTTHDLSFFSDTAAVNAYLQTRTEAARRYNEITGNAVTGAAFIPSDLAFRIQTALKERPTEEVVAEMHAALQNLKDVGEQYFRDTPDLENVGEMRLAWGDAQARLQRMAQENIPAWDALSVVPHASPAQWSLILAGSQQEPLSDEEVAALGRAVMPDYVSQSLLLPEGYLNNMLRAGYYMGLGGMNAGLADVIGRETERANAASGNRAADIRRTGSPTRNALVMESVEQLFGKRMKNGSGAVSLFVGQEDFNIRKVETAIDNVGFIIPHMNLNAVVLQGDKSVPITNRTLRELSGNAYLTPTFGQNAVGENLFTLNWGNNTLHQIGPDGKPTPILFTRSQLEAGLDTYNARMTQLNKEKYDDRPWGGGASSYNIDKGSSNVQYNPGAR